ncbi:related to AIF1-mitochondrial cell death effector [Sporisorium reilianum f. sp. reilianum]|uniref:Related to AIF1-mitochondrial cell death effector n=1 Tax=Sporisorium reilianum f. sp. reilianum TaxID=72559 RepID=A0A2N8U9Y7_9BASI|nr:related to AIF1-mitochondrial cell death effector [Sporisorium reilianum f. sp. reilianum]
MTIDMTPAPEKTIAVLGASYAGHRAIQVLVASLPDDWRVVVLERNTHANHLYAFPRMSVVRGHEHKVFIPYTNMFKPALALQKQHVLLHANVLALDQEKRLVSYELIDDKAAGVQWLQWDYLVYALGSHLPDPINVWSSSDDELGVRQHDGSKAMGVQWLRDAQDRIERAKSIVIVGGGALGVQLATDIAVTYGRSKKVTLTHSRAQLLPRFDAWMHAKAAARLRELGVELQLGSRVDLGSVSSDKKRFRLVDGRQLEGDLTLFCLGQTPNTLLLGESSLSESSRMAKVDATLQLSSNARIFVIGDAADAFGAINAGHTAWDQAEVAAHNILALISNQAELHEYRPTPPAIKVSLGMDRAIRQTMTGELIEVDGGAIDLNSTSMWTRRGLSTDNLWL